MAITNYTELKAAVASFLHSNTGLTSQIIDFISLGEEQINNDLSARFAEIEGSLTATTSSRYITLPTGFKRAYGLWITTYSPRQEIIYKAPTELPVITSNGQPQYYTIDGANIAFDCPANQAHTFTLRYKKGYNIAADTTNDLLTNNPGVYLYAALREAAGYTRDFEFANYAEARYMTNLAAAQSADSKNQSLATLSVEIGARGRNNIIDGDS